MPKYSDYIVYVDESGDHSLEKINSQYPIFVLAFCLFKKEEYLSECAPAMIRLKFEHLGHDQIVLHEREIRKQLGPFSFLRDATRRTAFLGDLNRLVSASPFTIVAVVIQKNWYRDSYAIPDNPYHLALGFGLERLYRHLRDILGCEDGTLHIVFESRGRVEDQALELEFRRTCDGQNLQGWTLPFSFVLADKRGNSTGLQLADLVARPIGLRVLRPGQTNRAWDMLEPKIRRSPAGRVEGWGLKIFPPNGSKQSAGPPSNPESPAPIE